MNNHRFEAQDLLGKRLAAHLNEANQSLGYDIAHVAPNGEEFLFIRP